MPRMGVPRHLGDRPGSRNTHQQQLEEADAARIRATQGLAAPRIVSDQPGYATDQQQGSRPFHASALTSSISNPYRGVPSRLQPLLPALDRRHVYGTTPDGEYISVTLLPNLVEEEAQQYIRAEARRQMPTMSVTINANTTR